LSVMSAAKHQIYAKLLSNDYHRVLLKYADYHCQNFCVTLFFFQPK
jgi:hypothetical protein